MDRRDFLKKSLAGATIAGVGVGTISKQEIALASSKKEATIHVPPGQLDEYYGIWSGGQSGELRILGIPSMRELMRIPVFNHDAATGWAKTDFSKELLGGRVTGDTHHVHLSYTNGTYDGRYIYVNDKAQGRLARVSIPNMEVDAVVDIPNSQGTHGIFPQRHKTGLVLCNSEFRVPVTDDPADVMDPSKYVTLHTAIDGETMKVVWQVMVSSNLDLCATDYKGLYSFATAYNTEGGVHLEEMISLDQDYLIVFHLERIANAVKAGRTVTLRDDPSPVVDAREDDSPYVLRIPIPKSPHGVNIDPTGRYAVCSGKLSPTVSIVDIEKIASAFAGEIKPRDCVVAEHEVGLGPLHTAFDGRGNGYTSLFIDSNITKWNIEKAIRAYQGEDVNPIVDRIDVYYQPGHTNASLSETKDADGKWLMALCKLSKDRFLNVGPMHPENDELIDISGEKMVLVHDGPAYAEPHDCIMLPKDMIHPLKFNDKKGPRHELYKAWAKEDKVKLTRHGRVFRKGEKSVRVYMPCKAPKFKLKEFEVFEGDEVQIIMTNTNNVADLAHGLVVSQHDVCFIVNALDTQSITFTAGKPGVYWYYCPYFCHALHLEMRGRMIVKARV
ncbi:MAG: nitrous-oxide reductase [Candidatus Polarisedimenticolaceae bacterium]|nr:nitrous-oxide reductase [Candidatus Polarisedimenticolaceae bacterium]